MLVFHIVAGSIALLAGFVALFSTKGGRVHRGAGTAFAVAMLAMAATGALMAALSPEKGTAISVVAGGLAFHLAGTGWLTVRPPARGATMLLAGFAVLGTVVATRGGQLGLAAVASGGRFDGVPAAMYFVFAGLAALAAGLDARVLAGARLDGRGRLARHLWRMGIAMLIATMSFFLGQADEFPAWLRHGATTAGPPLVVLAVVVGHLAKTFSRHRFGSLRRCPDRPDLRA